MGHRGLEIEENIGFQNRAWLVQRVGWGAMAFLVLGACAGLLGPGALSRTMAGDKDGIVQVRYNRLERALSPIRVVVRLAGGAAYFGRIRMRLNHDYLEGVRIRRIDPEPERMETGEDGMVFVFRVSNPRKESQVVFDLEGRQAGPLQGRLTLLGGAGVEFSQFLLP